MEKYQLFLKHFIVMLGNFNEKKTQNWDRKHYLTENRFYRNENGAQRLFIIMCISYVQNDF